MMEPLVFRKHEPEPSRHRKLQTLIERLIAAEEITLDDAIIAVAGLTPAADRGIYFTSATAASLFTLTAFARTILDDADAGAVRSTIGSSLFRDVVDTAVIGDSGGVRYWLNSGAQTEALTNPALAQFADLEGRDANTEWVRFHDDAKPVILQLGKNRGDGIPGSPTFARKTLANDRLAMIGIYGGKDSDGTTTAYAHAGYLRWTAEADNDGGNEIDSIVHLQPGSASGATGAGNGLEINCKMQASFSGPNQLAFGGGVDHQAILRLGVGGGTNAPLRFTTTGAALLATPVPGALEVNASGKLYLTAASGDRYEVYTGRIPNLSALEALTPTTEQLPYYTGVGTAALTAFTAAGRALLDDADAAAQRVTLGVTASGADTTYAYRANNLSDLANAATARANLGLTIGTHVQAYDADLATIASLTATTDNFIVSVAGAWASRTPAQVRTTLGLGTAALANIGTSGDAVGKLNAANTWSAQQVFSNIRMDSTAPIFSLKDTDSTGAACTGHFNLFDQGNNELWRVGRSFADGNLYISNAGGGNIVFGLTIGATKATINSTGLDVIGESRSDTLRIDVAATAATPVPTHTFPINLNGTVYRVPCVI